MNQINLDRVDNSIPEAGFRAGRKNENAGKESFPELLQTKPEKQQKEAEDGQKEYNPENKEGVFSFLGLLMPEELQRLQVSVQQTFQGEQAVQENRTADVEGTVPGVGDIGAPKNLSLQGELPGKDGEKALQPEYTPGSEETLTTESLQKAKSADIALEADAKEMMTEDFQFQAVQSSEKADSIWEARTEASVRDAEIRTGSEKAGISQAEKAKLLEKAESAEAVREPQAGEAKTEKPAGEPQTGEAKEKKPDAREGLQNSIVQEGNTQVSHHGLLQKTYDSYHFAEMQAAGKAGNTEFQMQVSKPEEIPDRLAKELLVRTSEDRREFEIQIEPEYLGKITVKVLYEAGKSVVSILCSSSKTMELLAQNAGDIGTVMEQNLGEPTEIYVEQQKTDMFQQEQEENSHAGRQSEQSRQKEQQEKLKAQKSSRFLQELRLGILT